MCLYEYELKSQAGTFDLENKNLCSFLKDKSIFLGGINKTDKKKANNCRGYILYNQRTHKVSKNDKVHHILRHIRDSIAHGLISKTHNQVMNMTDKSSTGGLTMEGKVKAEDFYTLLNILIKSKKQ